VANVRITNDRTKQVVAAVKNATVKALTESAIIVQDAAKSHASGSVDTGNLLGSISRSVDGGAVQGISPPANKDGGVHVSAKGEAVVGTNVHYGPYIEYGTYKMAAQSFMRPAMDESKDKVKQKMEFTYRDAIKGATP
jgi:HK97 gp10 family phage protein